MASLAEYFQAFHSYAYENTLTANARALYYTILGEFNNAYWKRSELSKSVRELRVIGGFKSESIVQRAKAQLGNENILQISKNKNGDVYRLVEPAEWKNSKIPIVTDEERNRNAIGTQSEQMGNTCGTLEGVSNYACAKDNKDSKDKEDIKNFFTTAATATRTREGKRSVNSAEVQQAWFDCEGEKLKGGVAFGLIDLENEYGTQVLIDAIFAAHQANSRPRLSFNFVKAVLENRQKGDKPRGKIIRLDSVPTDDQLAGGVWRNAGLPPGVKSRFGNNGDEGKL